MSEITAEIASVGNSKTHPDNPHNLVQQELDRPHRPWGYYVREHKLPWQAAWVKAIEEITTQTHFFDPFAQVSDPNLLAVGIADGAVIDGVLIHWDEQLKNEGSFREARWVTPHEVAIGGKPINPFDTWVYFIKLGLLPEQVDTWSHEWLHRQQRKYRNLLNAGVIKKDNWELLEAQAWRTFTAPIGNPRYTDPEEVVFEMRGYEGLRRERAKFGVECVDQMMALGMNVSEIARVLSTVGGWRGDKNTKIEKFIEDKAAKLGWDRQRLQREVSSLSEKLEMERLKAVKIARSHADTLVAGIPIAEDDKIIRI